MSDSFFRKDKKEPIDEKILEKVKSILIGQLELEPEQIKLESRITEDLGADSLDTVELIMALEESFSIEITDEDAEKMQTVRQVVEYIQKQKPGIQEQKEKNND